MKFRVCADGNSFLPLTYIVDAPHEEEAIYKALFAYATENPHCLLENNVTGSGSIYREGYCFIVETIEDRDVIPDRGGKFENRKTVYPNKWTKGKHEFKEPIMERIVARLPKPKKIG